MAGRVVTLLTVVLAVWCPATAVGQEEFFATGNTLYQNGDYEGALTSYRRVVDAGFESAALYYNIGNSYFKLGELGQSILFFERAARLDPGDENVRANLALARSLTADEITPLPTFWLVRLTRWWVGLLPFWLLEIVVAAAYLVALGSLTVKALRGPGNGSRLLRNVAVVAFVVFVVFGANLFARELGVGRKRVAIVMEQEVPVYSAPTDDRSLLVFNVHEGTRVRIDQQSGQWAEVVLDDGTVGWLRVEAVEEI